MKPIVLLKLKIAGYDGQFYWEQHGVPEYPVTLTEWDPVSEVILSTPMGEVKVEIKYTWTNKEEKSA